MSNVFDKKELNSIAKNAVDSDKVVTVRNPEDAIKVICTYWPLLKKVIQIVKLFTGAKVDQALDKVLEAGEMLCPEVPVAAAKKAGKR
jgi:hypothetical protein